MTLHREMPRADDPDACTRRALHLLAEAREATGFWRHAHRMTLLAEAQVYATLGSRPAAIEISTGRPLPRRSGT